MIEPLRLSNHSHSLPKPAMSASDLDEYVFDEEWLNTATNPNLFNRQQLQQAVANQRFVQRQLAFEWRAATRGTLTRMSQLSAADAGLSLFCLLLAVWILIIWRSDAPFWWVPGLSLFFAIAAVAALHDAIWQTPQAHKAQLRRQLRRSQSQMKRLSNRLAMVD